jgi:hypothetical protein
MPRPGDWYPAIHTSDPMIMDDKNRNRLSDDEIRRIVDKLKEVASAPEMRE